MEFMYYVYAYNKNYEFREDFTDRNSNNSSPSNDPNNEEHSNYKIFTYDWLIEHVISNCED